MYLAVHTSRVKTRTSNIPLGNYNTATLTSSSSASSSSKFSSGIFGNLCPVSATYIGWFISNWDGYIYPKVCSNMSNHTGNTRPICFETIFGLLIIWYSSPSPGSDINSSPYIQDLYLPDIIASHLTDVQHCKERGNMGLAIWEYGFVYSQYVFCGLPIVTTWSYSSNVRRDNISSPKGCTLTLSAIKGFIFPTTVKLWKLESMESKFWIDRFCAKN